MIFRLTERDLQTKFGTLRKILYYDWQKESIALVMGNISTGEYPVEKGSDECVKI